MKRKPKVYVAGPYSHPDPVENIRNAVLIGDRLLSRGFCPFIPHLTGTWHMLCPRKYQEWLDYDNQWIPVCDAIYRLPGASNGADLEIKLAVSLGIPIFYSMDEICGHFGKALEA